MIPIIYEATETAFISNGLGRLRDCLSCVVTEERNGIYEVEMTYPITGANYDLIQPGRILGVTHDDTGDVQPFDLVGASKPIDGVVTFHGVHVSYRLTTVTAFEGSTGGTTETLSTLLQLLQVDGEPQNNFSYSADFDSTAFMAAADGTPRSVRQLLGGIEGSILDTFGGEYEWDRFNVILHRNRGTAKSTTVRYGVNMVNYQEDIDYQGSYTSCVPYWIGTGPSGAEAKVVGTRVDSGATGYAGRIECVPLDLSDKFETQPTGSQLRAEALSQMQSQQPYLPARTIAVDFVRLQDVGYPDLGNLADCRLCDTITVVFPDYKTQGQFKIVKTVWNALEDRYDAMELGTLATTLSEALGITTGLDRSTGGGADPEDYVTATGTSGEWKYRKWHSGTVEAWTAHDFGSQTPAAWGSVYYKELNLAIPSGIFTTAPNRVYITGSGRQWWVVGYSSVTTTSVQTIRFVRPASSAATIGANVYCLYIP